MVKCCGAIWIRDPDTDTDPYRDTGKTCLFGGMHCFSASVLVMLCTHMDSQAHVHSEPDKPNCYRGVLEV